MRNRSLARVDWLMIVQVSTASFITYLSMYAFRKPFTAATFDGVKYFGMDYKILLVIAQLIGYTLSKFLGVRFLSELGYKDRPRMLVLLMGTAWLSLLFFALVPAPYNIFFMFLNGLPLGMIWGVVFGYLEGRRVTELLGAVMASSFIVSSGLVKNVGRWLLDTGVSSERWMPFVTGLIFVPVLALGIILLVRTRPP
jgi:sugar phosphate permease